MLERQLLRGGHIQLQPAKDGWTRHVNYVPPREVCVAREVVVASTDAASLPTASIVGEEETAEGIRLQVNPATLEPGEVLEEEGRKEGNRGGEPLLEVEEKEGVSSVPSVKPLDEWTEFEVSGWVGTQVGAGRVWQRIAAVLDEADIDGAALQSLDLPGLQLLGVSRVHATTLLHKLGSAFPRTSTTERCGQSIPLTETECFQLEMIQDHAECLREAEAVLHDGAVVEETQQTEALARLDQHFLGLQQQLDVARVKARELITGKFDLLRDVRAVTLGGVERAARECEEAERNLLAAMGGVDSFAQRSERARLIAAMLQQAAAKPVPVVEAGVVDVCFTGQVAFNRTVRVAMRPHRVDKRGLGGVRELGVASVVGSACFNGDRAYAPDCVLRGGDEYFCSEGQGDSFLEAHLPGVLFVGRVLITWGEEGAPCELLLQGLEGEEVWVPVRNTAKRGVEELIFPLPKRARSVRIRLCMRGRVEGPPYHTVKSLRFFGHSHQPLPCSPSAPAL